jgi:hypothetical protein
MKKGSKTSRSQHMCWWPKVTFWEIWSVQFPKLEHPVFTVMRLSIFLNGCKLYIFHKLDHKGMFFRLCMCFSDNLLKFHSRTKEVLQTTIIWTQTEDFNPPWWRPRRDDQNGYMKHMIWSSDEEVMTFWKCLRLPNRRIQFSRIRPKSE